MRKVLAISGMDVLMAEEREGGFWVFGRGGIFFFFLRFARGRQDRHLQPAESCDTAFETSGKVDTNISR